jgi:hypothetical protein
MGRRRTFVPYVRTAPTVDDARAVGSGVATRAASIRGASGANVRNDSQKSHDQDHFHIALLPGYLRQQRLAKAGCSASCPGRILSQLCDVLKTAFTGRERGISLSA